MKTPKPLVWEAGGNIPYKCYLLFKEENPKVSFIHFVHGRPLPFDSGNPNLSYTLMDPKDYQLLFWVESLPEKWLKYDCLPNNMGGMPPVMNSRALNLLMQLCPNDFQAFPVKIKNGNPKLPDFENHDYFLLNITHFVDAIDREQSILKIDKDEDIKGFRKLCLKNNCLEGHHLARLEGYEPIIIASPQLVALFKKHKIKGVGFLTDEEAYP